MLSMAGRFAASDQKVADRFFSVPFMTHEAVLAAAKRLVADNPFADAEVTIVHKRFSGTYAMCDASVENGPVSGVRITDYGRRTADALAVLRADPVFCEAVGPDECCDAGAGYPDASSASVTVRVKTESETFYVLVMNEKIQVYGYEDDGVVAALERWMG